MITKCQGFWTHNQPGCQSDNGFSSFRLHSHLGNLNLCQSDNGFSLIRLYSHLGDLNRGQGASFSVKSLILC